MKSKREKKYFVCLPLFNVSGSRHVYSNLGYLLLGRVEERMSGRKYSHVVHDLLQPLDINDVAVGNAGHSSSHYNEVEYVWMPKQN